MSYSDLQGDLRCLRYSTSHTSENIATVLEVKEVSSTINGPQTLTFDLWPWSSNSSERGTKHVFRVNFAQIRSAIPEIFHTQTKNHRLTAPKTELSAAHCVRYNNNTVARICIQTSGKALAVSKF